MKLRPTLTRRRMLDASQVRDLAIVSHEILDALHAGESNSRLLRSLVEMVLTWHRAAVLMGRGVPEMAPQVALATELVEAYGRTGRLAITPRQYQLLRYGVMVMEILAVEVDLATAVQASHWSNEQINLIFGALTPAIAQLERAAA